jgi:hypothetical protein
MSLIFEEINIGDVLPEYTAGPLTRTHFVRYAGASGDFNPLHHDETFARTVGLDRVIAHGMLIMGIVGEAISSWITQKNLRKFHARFMSMTEPVDWDDLDGTAKRATIVATGKVVNKFEEKGEKLIRCDIVVKDLLGSRKLDGYFIAAFP